MRIFIIAIIFFIALKNNAQNEEPKFGKVTKEEVAQTEHSLDRKAEAAILFKKERFFYDYFPEKGFGTVREVHLRIKIYNKSGLDWATSIIPLYTSSSGEQKINGIKGFTYNLEGGRIVEEKLRKEGIFSENISKYRNQVSITMPKAKVGSVIDLEYQITSDLTGYMDDFRLQHGIPMDLVALKIEVPEYFNFKRFTRGFHPVSLQESNKNRSISYNYKTERGTGYRGVGTSTISKNAKLEFFEKQYVVTATNIPALKEVDFTDNIENYRSALVFELESTKFPNQGYKMYSQTWEDVANSIYNYDDFGGELDKNRFFNEAIDPLIGQFKDQKELLNAIYELVQNRMNWNKYFGVGCMNGIKKAFEDKRGNVADINLLLTAMLRYAGFKANPVLVSTKSNGIPLYPTTNGFNYVITAVEVGDNYSLLDATEKMLAINDLPTRAMNWNGRLVRKDGTSKPVALVPKSISNQFTFLQIDISEDGSFEGKMRTRLTNNLAYEYRAANVGKTNEEIIEHMTNRHSILEIEDFELANQKTPNKPLEEALSFANEDKIEKIGDKLYLNPLLFLSLKENPFKLDTREYPIDFSFPFSKKINITYKIPTGYKIESIPENIAIGLPGKLGVYNMVLQQHDSGLQLVSTTEIREAIIPAQYYVFLKEFYNQMLQKQNEKVVLSKI